MSKKILLLLAFLVMLIDLSSCTMHTVHGTPYRIGTSRRTSHHWGTRSHYNQRRALWGKHRYGHRPHDHRGKFH